MAKLFISYAVPDRVMVESLAERLRSNGHDPWMDAVRIQGGSQWETEIFYALTQCEFCLIAVTPSALQSEWVKKETEIAKKLQKPLIPLIMHAIPIPGGLAMLGVEHIQGINFAQYGFAEGMKRLLDALSSLPALRARLDDESAQLRIEAYKALIAIRTGKLPEPLDSPASTPAIDESAVLAQALSDPCPRVRGKAVIELAQRRREVGLFKETSAQDVFWRNVYHSLSSHLEQVDAENYWARMAEVALVFTYPADRQKLVLLEMAVTTPDVEHRRIAISAVGMNQYSEGLDIALSAAHDPDKTIRRVAVEVLGNFDDQRILPILAEAIQDETPTVRFAAIKALAAGDKEDRLEILRNGLQTTDPLTRIDIVKAVGHVPQALNMLLDQLSAETHEDVLYSLINVFKTLRDDRIPVALSKFTTHAQKRIREATQSTVEALSR